ncbi:MFS transporter [Aneurinibacillus sp. Ricciae_BoGa-3]|uniref:MFS transporter n=1 Tax=Aneurinibacillus sp. Ricciae_BoGa-3 TaxID=3022697 RepID=UPI002340F47D|nr:MFS transporter [Aneurinibacillus sp. Ricciae_BoGa-3]WCK56127.1 MFS transporter [Aneurinibacillus sp. Ricciae_BoGa-3]
MEKAKNTSFISLTTLALIPIVMVLGNSMLVPGLPTMESQLGISKFQSSLIISVFSFAAGIVMPFVGYLSDRFGRKPIIGIALLLYGLGGIFSGVTAWLIKDSYPYILIGRIFQGFGAAGTSPVAMALIGDMYKGGEESRVLGINEAANGFGKIISPILGSLIALISWYAVFFTFPVLCFIVAALTWFVIKEPERPEPVSVSKYVQKIKGIFKKKGSWLISSFLVGSIGLFILFGVLFYLSNILEDEYNVSGFLKGPILAIPLLGLVTTSYFTGASIKQNMKLIRKIMVLGLIILTAAMIIVSFFENIYVIVALLTVGSIGIGLTLPCVNTIITGAVQKSERGMITALYGSVRFFGVAVGPPFFGWLMDISHRALFFTVSGISLATLIVSYFFINPQKQSGPKTKPKDTEKRPTLNRVKAPT